MNITRPELLATPTAAQAWSDACRLAGRRVVLVPTMGALHDGHRTLIEVAQRHGDAVVVSIFVNPLQFDRENDLAAYPRPIDDDLTLCAHLGVDAVYAPLPATLYPPDFETRVEVGATARYMEGEGRPGHFSGVTTVVTKLFHAVRPHAAVFGQKDLQQLVIVERITTDLDFGIEIVRVPTVRDADGVAMSSRNQRLTSADRAAAVCIPAALDAARRVVLGGERSTAAIAATAMAVLRAEPRARVEYVQVTDLISLAPIEELDRPGAMCLAVWFGEVRLIDNVLLSPGSPNPSGRSA